MTQEPIFITPRLIARHINADDLEAMFDVYSDADAMRWVDDGQPITLAECKQWIEVTSQNYLTRGYGMTALVERETEKTIGFCGLVHPNGQPEAEIKYALLQAYWGRGFATEAVCAMLQYGAHHFNLHQVIATIAPENLASQHVVMKAGMQLATPRHNEDGSLTQVFVWHSNRANIH